MCCRHSASRCARGGASPARAAVTLLSSSSWVSVYAANPTITERFVKDVSLDIGGEFWIDNPIGNIDIIGVDGPGLSVTAVKTIVGIDQAALKVFELNFA